jgi:hypothetical protein
MIIIIIIISQSKKTEACAWAIARSLYLVPVVKIELRYFYYISLCCIDSIIVITVLAYVTVVAFLLVAYFSIVMLWQDIYRI